MSSPARVVGTLRWPNKRCTIADRLDQAVLYQIRRAAALSWEFRKVSWIPDDAIRYRFNFIDTPQCEAVVFHR